MDFPTNPALVFCIYSTGESGEDSQNGFIQENDVSKIHIYKNSVFELKALKRDALILFFQTKLKKVFAFKWSKDQFTQEEEYFLPIKNTQEGYLKISSIPQEYEVSIGQFKNFYFLNIDSLTPWVRSPLASRRNVLVLHSETDILPNFSEWKDALKSPHQYARKYEIRRTPEKTQTTENQTTENQTPIYSKNDEENHLVVLEYEYNRKSFGKEFSEFFTTGHLDFKIAQKPVEECFLSTQNTYNKKYFSRIEKYEDLDLGIKSFSAWYDLTRSFIVEAERDDVLDELQMIEEKKQEVLENFLQKFQNEKAKKEKISYRFLIIAIGLLSVVIVWNLLIYIKVLPTFAPEQNIQRTFGLVTCEFLILFGAFFCLKNYNLYIKIIELYTAHILLIKSDDYYKKDSQVQKFTSDQLYRFRTANLQRINTLPEKVSSLAFSHIKKEHSQTIPEIIVDKASDFIKIHQK